MAEREPFGFDMEGGRRVTLGGGMSGFTYRGWIEITKPADGTGAKPRERVAVALKEINNVRDGEGYSLKREVMLLGKVGRQNHPCLVRFLRYFFDGHTPIIATELVRGDTLLSLVQKRNAADSLGTKEWLTSVLEWGAQLASGLEYLEALKIVHRDIKPGNIMIREVDQIPVLIDFGVGRSAVVQDRTDTTNTVPGSFVGTYGYASTEQFCVGPDPCSPDCGNPCRVSSRTDVYSLAATLWYALTGRPLFSKETDNFRNVALLVELKRRGEIDFSRIPGPRLFHQFLGEMLAPRAADRPSPIQVKERLIRILNGEFNHVPKEVRSGPAVAEAMRSTLQPLPLFVSLGSGLEIGATLMPAYAMTYWSPHDAAQIDFDDPAAAPARATYREVEELLDSINNDPSNLSGPWVYRLPTVEEWKVAAGFARGGGKTTSTGRFRRVIEDAGRMYEWTQDRCTLPECRKLCYLDGPRLAVSDRHKQWPKGVIRLIREPRAVLQPST